jgi:uncharacterized membrane protein YfhO
MNLDFTNDVSAAIDQVQTEKNFEFVSIDLTRKSSITSSYNETMLENFQQLKKTIEQKMTELIIERLKSYTNQTRSKKNTNVSKNSSTNSAKTQSNAKEMFHVLKKIQAAEKSQLSKKNCTNVEKISTSNLST